jgi:hypothetical protein
VRVSLAGVPGICWSPRIISQGPIVVIWDNVNVPRGQRRVREFVAANAEWLTVVYLRLMPGI